MILISTSNPNLRHYERRPQSTARRIDPFVRSGQVRGGQSTLVPSLGRVNAKLIIPNLPMKRLTDNYGKNGP